jgi:hypothetical protein
MRKGVSQLDLQNAFSGLSHEVAAGRVGRKTASTLAYLGLVLFQSDQLITENEFRAAAGPRWDYISALLDDGEADDASDGRTIDVSPNKIPLNPSRRPRPHAHFR